MIVEALTARFIYLNSSVDIDWLIRNIENCDALNSFLNFCSIIDSQSEWSVE